MARPSSALMFWVLVIVEISPAQDTSRKQIIACSPSDSTTFFFTNRTTAFYFGRACGMNASAMHGLNVLTQEYFEDYILRFDGNILDRASAEILIYPDRMVRKYSPQQITEEVALLDSLNVLSITVTSQVQGGLELIPSFPGSRQAQDFEIRWEREFGLLHLRQKALMQNDQAGKSPAWTAIATRPVASFAPFDARQREAYAKLFPLPSFAPGSLYATLQDVAVFYVIVGSDTKKLIASLHSRK